MAKNLTKLKRLPVGLASSNHILPFICHSKRLKTVRILRYGDLNGASLSFVPEHIYLPEKWNSKNVNLSYVQILRLGKY